MATDEPESRRVVEAALVELRNGRMIVVADDEDRENEGDLIMAAEFADSKSLAFIIRHTSGLLCVALTEQRADSLGLPLMVAQGEDPHGTAFAVSVDASEGVTTGISAIDRAAVARVLADESASAADLRRPGHVFPLRARGGGVLERPGHTESAVDLCRLAGLSPAGVLAELVADDGTMVRGDDLRTFADTHGLLMITVADLVAYRRLIESTLRREGAGRIPVGTQDWRAIAYRSTAGAVDHVALVLGDVNQAAGADVGAGVLVRVHSECLTGDVFGSRRCDCGEQLDAAMDRIAGEGAGAVVYLRGHEGRGIGLAHKLRAYSLQDEGLDTVDANLAQGLPADSREYGEGAQILRDLGIRDVRLMTNNPRKCQGLASYGVRVVNREPIVVPPNPANVAYLTTKRQRMGHQLMIGEVS